MARPLRVEFENAIYDVCSRGNAQQRIFWDDRDRNRLDYAAVAQRIRRTGLRNIARATTQLRKQMLNVEI
jgi:hypothetical protein